MGTHAFGDARALGASPQAPHTFFVLTGLSARQLLTVPGVDPTPNDPENLLCHRIKTVSKP
jgi:hypothetical protein